MTGKQNTFLLVLVAALLAGWLFLAASHSGHENLSVTAPISAPVSGADAALSIEAKALANLIDPLKLASLKGDRAANSRFCKIAYWLESTRRSGQDPDVAIRQAQLLAGYASSPRAEPDRESLIRNRVILERLGCLDAVGMAKLRKGNAPVITLGPYAGDIASVDHILPFSVVRELDTLLYNLEFMPSKMNRQKSASIGQRQVSLARKWHDLGLLSDEGLKAILANAKPEPKIK